MVNTITALYNKTIKHRKLQSRRVVRSKHRQTGGLPVGLSKVDDSLQLCVYGHTGTDGSGGSADGIKVESLDKTFVTKTRT